MRTWFALALMLLLACDGRQGHLDLWYPKRYAPPGGSATVELAVRPAIRSHLVHVDAESTDLGLPATVAFHDDHPSGFGFIITRTRDEKQVTHLVSVPIPASARPGRARVTLRVSYMAAEYAGPSSFRTTSGQETLQIPVTVVPPGLEGWVRLRDSLLPLGLLVAVAAACGLLSPRGGQGAWRTGGVFLLWAGWVAAVWPAFARPLAWALGLTAWWARGLLLGAGIYGLFWIMLAVEKLRSPETPPA